MKSNPRRSIPALCLLSALVGFAASAFPAQDPPILPRLPAVQVLATDPTGLTDASSAAFTVLRIGDSSASLIVKYTLAGTAVNGADYTGPNGEPVPASIEIPAGYSAADVVVVPRVNPANRGNKVVKIELAASDAYSVGRRDRAVISLIDDLYNDDAPKVTLAVEGGETGRDGVIVVALPATVRLVAEATDTDDQVVRVVFYASETALGSVTEPPFAFEWRNPRPGSYELFARAVDQFGKSSLSQTVPVVVKANLPTVKITSPTAASVPAGADVPIQAEVAPGSGSIAEVLIYGDGELLARLASGPYAATWTQVPPGKHAILVRVTDELGLSAAARFAFVAENKRPEVKLTNPRSGARFQAPATIELAAEVTDAENHPVKEVAFYANGRLLGSATAAPFTWPWKNVGTGSYRLQALATDAFGARGWSPVVPVFVTR